MKKKLNIFDYIDFKKFLRDWRTTEKETNSGFTHEYLCRKLGQKNRTYFNDVEKGRKTIGPLVLDQLIKLMKLSPSEAKYFRAMVGYGQPHTYEEKEFWFEQIVELNDAPKQMVDKSTYAFYKEWYHSTIRAFLDTCNFKDDYQEASRKLFSRVTPKQVKESIELLKKLGLVAPNKQGYLKPTEKVLSTGDSVKNDLIQKYQLANHEILGEILKKNEPDSHTSTQLSVSVSEEGYSRIKKRIRQLRSEVISIAHKDEQTADRVYRIAIHAYPETIKEQ